MGREATIHLAGGGAGSRNVRRLFRCSHGRWNIRSAFLRLHGKFGAGDYRVAVLSLLEEESIKVSADYANFTDLKSKINCNLESCELCLGLSVFDFA